MSRCSSGPFPSSFNTKPLYAPFLTPHSCQMPCLSHPWLDHLNNLRWVVQIMKLSIVQSPAVPSYSVSVRPRYCPQYPSLKQPQLMFFHQYGIPSFTPVLNDRQNYSSLYINLRIFLDSSWKTILIGKMEAKCKVTILRAFECNDHFEVIEHYD